MAEGGSRGDSAGGAAPDHAAPAWETVDALFQRALDVAPENRAAFVARETVDNPALGRAVRALLDAVDGASEFLESPLPLAAELDPNLIGVMERTGQRLGPYQLVETLGRGGMATVYLAARADGQWQQQVAIKILRRGLDTDDIVTRFKAERQILSSLQHPHIARLLDGGTTPDGLPFLVMERVEGQPITEYCDTRSLSIRERLRLFGKVATAVQYAHRNLVVHRDLKPSNILVDADGQPKLLDFGIAKVLGAEGEAGLQTRTGRRLLTPQYASPEQLKGEPVTTLSDVYQLGVLLCVLLSGERPSKQDTRDVVIGGETMTAPEPTRPSRLVSAAGARLRGASPDALAKRLRGDLDTIVLKALRESPDKRFGSVEAMAADVERFLEGRPITARPTTWAYRTRKLIRRRPLLTGAVVVGMLQLVSYWITLDRHASELETERNIAQAEAERAQEVQNFLVRVFRSPDPYSLADPDRGTEITVREALDLGVTRIRNELADRPALQGSLLGAIGDVYSGLGLGASALPLHEEALERARETFGEESPEVVHRMRGLGSALRSLNQIDSAVVVLEGGLALADRVLGPTDTMSVVLLNALGFAEFTGGNYEDAETRLLEALERAGQIDADSSGLAPPGLVSQTHYLLAETYPQLNAPERALASAEDAYVLAEQAYGPRHATTAVHTIGLANALASVDRIEESVPVYRRGIQLLTGLMGPEHPDVLNARNNLALKLMALGDLEGAEAAFRELLDLRVSTAGESSRGTADALQNLAVVVQNRGRPAEAERLLERAHGVYVGVLPEGHATTAFPLLTLAEIQLARADYEAAAQTAGRATEILSAALPEGHYATAVGRCRQGRALVALGRPVPGRALLVRAAETIAESTATPPAYEIECLEALISVLDVQADAGLLSRLRARLGALNT